MIKLINGDYKDYIKELKKEKIIIVTDPPFNIGYKYNFYKDKMKRDEYFQMLKEIFSQTPSVVIHYPEALHELSISLGYAPQRVISWVYNSNTPRQHRDIAFYNITPDFNKVRQPYKNPNDKRIQERIKNGCTGSKLYDWFEVNQVKNISKEKTEHPCQMPLKVMESIIGILPQDYTIVDVFSGSGTTAEACKKLNRNFIGIEIDEKYHMIASERIFNKIIEKNT